MGEADSRSYCRWIKANVEKISQKREEAMGEKEKVLVVDDEPSIRKYLQTLLEVDGFEVETVSSGKEALNKVTKGERPDFIILDVLMPEMNGIDTLRELMEIDRTLNVIMLSCSNEVGTVVEAIRIGAHDYLTKPFEKTELDAAMLKSRQKKQLATENQALRDYCVQVTEDLSFLAASSRSCKSLRWTCRFLFVAKAAWEKKLSRG